MLRSVGKLAVVGSALALTLGFGARKAAADSFSVSVHTPTVSVGYGNFRGHDSGFVSVYRPAPAPVVYCPPPAPVYRPVVVVAPPRHVCTWDRVPVTRVRYDDCGRRLYYTEYVRVRLCDDYHRVRNHDHRGRGHYDHHDYDDDHHYKRGKYDRDHYAHDWDNDRGGRNNHRGRDRD